jgi:ferredoxin
MPKLTVNGKTAEFDKDKRLVLAIEEMGVEIGHRCGGNARCTTCRVSFVSGEPAEMTRAEFEKLVERELLGQVRLSCQLTVVQDMEVRALRTKESEGWPDTGPRPEDEVVPEARWSPRSELERSS